MLISGNAYLFCRSVQKYVEAKTHRCLYLPNTAGYPAQLYIYPVKTIVNLILGNTLTCLPDSLGKLVKLKLLDVSKNLLTDIPDISGEEFRGIYCELRLSPNKHSRGGEG